MTGDRLRIEGCGPPLAPGEVLALLGAGAAEMVRALAGATRTGSPGLWLGERPLAGLPAHRRGLAAALRPPGLLPWRSVAGNVGLPLPRGQRAARVPAALAAMGLADGPTPTEAEAAMRVALARALAMAPPALLLEDAFAGLDPAARPARMALLRGLGPAVVLATADPATALLADRVGVVVDGAVRQSGAPREVYDRPADLLVAAALGPVNRLAGMIGQVWDDEAEVRLAAGATVVAPLAAPLPPGALCLVVVRPERVAVAAVAPEAMGEGALAATLREARFEGAQLRLRLALADGSELVALRPAQLRVPGLGEACALGWEAGAGLVFPA